VVSLCQMTDKESAAIVIHHWRGLEAVGSCGEKLGGCECYEKGFLYGKATYFPSHIIHLYRGRQKSFPPSASSCQAK
jgi:hypothetical protein